MERKPGWLYQMGATSGSKFCMETLFGYEFPREGFCEGGKIISLRDVIINKFPIIYFAECPEFCCLRICRGKKQRFWTDVASFTLAVVNNNLVDVSGPKRIFRPPPRKKSPNSLQTPFRPLGPSPPSWKPPPPPGIFNPHTLAPRTPPSPP